MTEFVLVGGKTDPPILERFLARVRAVSPAAWRQIDVMMAVAVFVGFTIPAALGYPSHAGSATAVLFFGACASLPLAVRRRWPLPVFTVVVAASFVATLAGVRFTPFASNAGPAVALAMYTVAVGSDRRWSLAGLGLTSVASLIVAAVAIELHPEQDQNAVLAIIALAGWYAGDMVRWQRRYRDQLAARRSDEADERARRGIAEERLRISREVHDVVSHNLSVIAVQSGVGRMLFDDQPEQARAALAQVESLSRGALDELRRLLDSSLRPAPGVDDITELVERMTAGGLDVTLEVEGEPIDVPPLLGLSAYRIVQEALTNVVKHTGGAPTLVTLQYRPDALVVEVEDEGWVPMERLLASRSMTDSGSGMGIQGMRERAALFGGEVTIEKVRPAGFRVVARLPVGAAR
jgi:signal transduction histidine kinase